MTRRDVVRSAVAAPLTDAPARFLRYETVSLAGPRACTYGLRGRDAAAVIRHGTTDVNELALSFLRARYALPAAAREALGAAGRAPRILDLGARTGLRALALLLSLPGASATSVEPDPMNLIILRRTIAANPSLRWEAIAGAVGHGEYLCGPGYARRLPAGITDAERRRLAAPVDAGALMAEAELVAMNVHGHEWRLLCDPRFREGPARVAIVECHAYGCPERDPAAAGGRLLAEAGYAVLVRRDRTSDRATLIAWRGETPRRR